MRDQLKSKLGAASLAAVLALGFTAAAAQDDPPFGDEASVAYAAQLWDLMLEADLVGDDAIRSYAYEGNEPHGVILEQIETTLTVDGHEGILIVKTNFMAEDLTTDQVMDAARGEFLDATTIMFKREEGYAPESADWFWAKYMAGGELDVAPNDLQMAGRVAGCIGCHEAAPGGDFVYLHNRFAE